MGGTRSGGNLFHSFEQFSVPTRGTAHFNNALDIQNIFARITSQSSSMIDGIIQTNGNANLFLLNPNGIIFGANASLDVGGSFLATTANSINFDGFQFRATNPPAFPTLTISVPTGLQFGTNSASIINRSQASPDGIVNTYDRPVGLQVRANQSLTLLGNGVFLRNGNLTARGGQIRLGSIAPSSLVSLIPSGTSYRPTYVGNQNFRDVRLSSGSYIDTSGGSEGRRNGGAIDLRGRNILLTNDSAVVSRSYQGVGENLQLIATQSLTIANDSAVLAFAEQEGSGGEVILRAGQTLTLRGSFPSLVGSQASKSTVEGATAADVVINARNILLQDGSRIEASSFGAGQGGDIQIQASSVEVVGFSPVPIDGDGDGIEELAVGDVTSGIFSQTEGSGDAGNLTIDTRRLVILDGGVISTATFAEGDGGTLNINAGSILVDGASPSVTRNQYRSGIFVSAEPGAIGDVGALDITVDQLIVRDRGEISANNRGSGRPGSATLNVENLDIFGGGEVRASSLGEGQGGSLIVNAESIQIAGTGTIGTVEVPSALAALARRSGDAGNLQITTSSLDVRDGAEISVSGTRLGSAGNMFISADQITVTRGRIAASTESGSGAEITLEDLDVLLLSDRSQITAQANEEANGGNIFTNASNGFIVGSGENNDILANADAGRGGNITIDAQSILGIEERLSMPINTTNDIDASSQFGTPGSVTLIQPDVDPSQGLTELPTDLVDASNLIAQTCSTRGAVARNRSEFVITGRGGLPSSPAAARSVGVTSTDWATLDLDTEQTESWELGSKQQDSPIIAATVGNSSNELIEAQGWVIGEDGDVILVAESPTISQTAGTNIQCQDGSDSEE